MFLSSKKENGLFNKVLVASLLLVSFVFCGVFTCSTITASAVDTHTLTVSCDQSYGDFSVSSEEYSISKTETGAEINDGTTFTVTITANEGYKLTVVSAGNTITYNNDLTEAYVEVDQMGAPVNVGVTFDLMVGYHAVTFDLNGGNKFETASENEIVVGVLDGEFINTNYGTDCEYEFEDGTVGVLRGWYTDEELATLYSGEDVTADVILYANWARVVDF